MASEAAVSVQEHLAHAVEAVWILTRKFWQEQMSEKRQTGLPSMRMTGELQVEAVRGGARVREIGFVGEEDGGTFSGELFQYPVKVGHAFQGAIHAAEVQHRFVPMQGSDRVGQLGHAACGEGTPYHLWVRCVVVVAEDGEHAVGSAKPAQSGD